ncbi:cupin domain-containing protein [Chromobacterium sp. ASV23]|uniref:cupin domain-containing protein n=1 Tax=Chromobacterium sp. ASV23 TaxID=2795110 RepID=UPI0018EA958C|nr:cupin domain-containing protein [Chromobacterium sp. ASV23]
MKKSLVCLALQGLSLMFAFATSIQKASAMEPTIAILAPDEGEQLTRRWGYPMTIKVSPATTGSKNFSIGTEDIAPGNAIPPHRHHHSEEVVIVQSGVVEARIGDQTRKVPAGSIIYAPANTWMNIANKSNSTATVIWIFPQPGFEDYVRATSVPAGQPVTPLKPTELAEIRSKYQDHIELQAPSGSSYPTSAGNQIVLH